MPSQMFMDFEEQEDRAVARSSKIDSPVGFGERTSKWSRLAGLILKTENEKGLHRVMDSVVHKYIEEAEEI